MFQAFLRQLETAPCGSCCWGGEQWTERMMWDELRKPKIKRVHRWIHLDKIMRNAVVFFYHFSLDSLEKHMISRRVPKACRKKTIETILVLVAADHFQQFPACWTARIFRCHQCCEHQLFLLWSGDPSSGAAGSFLEFSEAEYIFASQNISLVWMMLPNFPTHQPRCYIHSSFFRKNAISQPASYRD